MTAVRSVNSWVREHILPHDPAEQRSRALRSLASLKSRDRLAILLESEGRGGRSSARLERQVVVLEVAGSIPVAHPWRDFAPDPNESRKSAEKSAFTAGVDGAEDFK